MTCPSEQSESEAFSQWLTIKGIRHHHGADNLYTKSWGQKHKMKAAGFSRGFPDFCIILPARKGLVFVEMKKEKGGQTSEFQKEWVDALNQLDGVEARVCAGADVAIDYISSFL